MCRECRALRRGGCESSRCRCAKCKAAAVAKARAWAERYQQEHGEHPSTTYRRQNGQVAKPRKRKACGWCGIVHPLNESGTTLNTEGMTHAHWLRYHGKPSASRELVFMSIESPKGPALTVAPIAPSRGGVFYQGACAWCGVDFTGWSTFTPPATCSKRCERGRGRARQGRFSISPIVRARIYERDGWTCAICEQPTSREWSSADPWSPTLDHIEPQSHALVPDHSEANLRTAHALCNAIRGDARMTDDEIRAELERRSANVPS